MGNRAAALALPTLDAALLDMLKGLVGACAPGMLLFRL
jgi:hypothetical protein